MSHGSTGTPLTVTKERRTPVMASTDIELRPHQQQAVTAAAHTLRTTARASVVAACGTGKTLIAARTATRVAPHGRVLVLVPTLDLTRTRSSGCAWREHGVDGRAIARGVAAAPDLELRSGGQPLGRREHARRRGAGARERARGARGRRRPRRLHLGEAVKANTLGAIEAGVGRGHRHLGADRRDFEEIDAAARGAGSAWSPRATSR